MEIDLSTLSDNQKKFYVQLLAQSNLEFTRKDSQFVAQFKVEAGQISGLGSGLIPQGTGAMTRRRKNRCRKQ